VIKTCERCDKSFDARPWNAGRFCTRKCLWALTPQERFAAKVQKQESGCWLYTGNTHPVSGYGSFGVAAGNIRLAHRYAYGLAHGPIPGGLHVCHKCDVRLCVNPSHLFVGTPADNQADKVSKGRQLRGEQAGMAVLTNDKVLAIRAAAGLQREIAAAFGVSRPLVSMIKSRKAWAHL